ncbi:MAG: chemotaxis protein CheW [Treponema sp.]|nr:chemotaxis protein CheW [Treponema sp.]
MEAENMTAENQQVNTATEDDSQNKKESITVIDFKMVTFSLSGKDYAIDIMNVKEIAKAGRFTYVPNALPFVLGVYNLRGDIIPILDLRLFFNIQVPEHTGNKLENLLILSVGEQTFGVVVDKIDKVVGVQKSKIQPPHPLFGDINIKYIYGVVEANKRLYILLDIAKIFNSRSIEEKNRKLAKQVFAENSISSTVSQISAREPEENVAAERNDIRAAGEAETPPRNDTSVQELKFIAESLKGYRKFSVTALNENWVRSRFSTWKEERGEGNTQLQNENDADAFLKTFWSTCSGTWWTKEYADAIYKLLPDNTAKQICVWNPGCGKGQETYSLACVLNKRYPGSKIRIYAQDIDLLNVSNAPLLSVPNDIAVGWFDPFITKKANGEYTFTQQIKDSIMFEYHDCMNTNALPVIDLILARDILSLLDEKGQNAVINDFGEKIKGNGTVIIGENEIILPSAGFAAKTVGALCAYSKK